MSTQQLPLFMRPILEWPDADDATIAHALFQYPPASFVLWVANHRVDAFKFYGWLCEQAKAIEAEAGKPSNLSDSSHNWRP